MSDSFSDQPTPSPIDPPAEQETHEQEAVLVAEVVGEPRPWGFWATIGFSVLCMVLFLVVQGLVAGLVLAATAMAGAPENQTIDVEALESNGLFVALSTIAAAPICVGFLIFVVRLRGPIVGWYLGFSRPRGSTALKCLAAWAVYVVAVDGLTYLVGRPVVPSFMVDAYETAGWLPLLLVAILVAAPLFEEIFFRGFLYRGVASSPLGPLGAIMLTSACWSVIHMQYDWFQVGGIFVLGLLLGAARQASGSVLLTIILHSLQNLAATIELAVYLYLRG